jgi:hypothetical protein
MTAVSVKLKFQLHLVSRKRTVQVNFHSPIRLHGFVFNEFSTFIMKYILRTWMWYGSGYKFSYS